MKKQGTIYYESLDDISIWAWEQVHKRNSFKYLCKQGEPDERALQVYRGLLYSFEKVSAPLLKLKRDILVKVIDLLINIVQNNKDPKDLDDAKMVLQAIALTGEHHEWLFEKDFAKTGDQKIMLSQLALLVKRHETFSGKMKEHPQSLNEKIVTIESKFLVSLYNFFEYYAKKFLICNLLAEYYL